MALSNRYSFRLLDGSKAPAQGGDHISQCNALLDNRMQCTRASEYLVTDSEHPEKPYQVCKRHAIILESEGLISNLPEKEIVTDTTGGEKLAVEGELNTPPSELAPQTSIPPVAKTPAATSGAGQDVAKVPAKTVAELLTGK